MSLHKIVQEAMVDQAREIAQRIARDIEHNSETRKAAAWIVKHGRTRFGPPWFGSMNAWADDAGVPIEAMVRASNIIGGEVSRESPG